MKRPFSVLSAALLLVFLSFAVACEPVDDPIPQPTPTPVDEPSISLDCLTFHRFSNPDSVVVIVSAEENASFDVQIPDDAASWVSTSTLHGTRSGGVGFKIDTNSSGRDRSAAITFLYGKDKTHRVYINQESKSRSSYYESWGIAGTVLKEHRNSRPYSWYIDQANTGPLSNENCGPSCVTMVAKWYNRLYDKNTEHARSLYRPTGGWWYMSDITGFLGAKLINNRLIVLPGTDFLKNEIDKGNVVIVCLDMNPLSYNDSNTERIDRFYRTNPQWGHFLVLYGYIETEKELFFEVCDPNSYGKTYLDQTLKGDGRFYRGGEIYRSVSTWSSRVCVIEHP